jgi:DNA-binding transcriptional LysR family regulator
VDIRKLKVLVELSRLGTMSAVAAATGYGTSSVSQQLAALEREAGVPLLETAGRRVRLTPAGRRLVGHAEGILAAITAAELDLAAGSQPSGLVRVAGYTTALRQYLLPVADELARSYPLLELELQEREPTEVDELLDADQIDLGFVHDYTLVPRGGRHVRALLGSSPMMLAVRPDSAVPALIRTPGDLESLRDELWIGNSRDSADDELASRFCALAGWTPRIRHRMDSLELVIDLVLAGHGVSLLPADAPGADRVRMVPVALARIDRRMWSVVRAGTQAWPATTAVIDAVRRHAQAPGSAAAPPGNAAAPSSPAAAPVTTAAAPGAPGGTTA